MDIDMALQQAQLTPYSLGREEQSLVNQLREKYVNGVQSVSQST